MYLVLDVLVLGSRCNLTLTLILHPTPLLGLVIVPCQRVGGVCGLVYRIVGLGEKIQVDDSMQFVHSCEQ